MAASISKFYLRQSFLPILAGMAVVFLPASRIWADLNNNPPEDPNKKTQSRPIVLPTALPVPISAEVNRGGETKILLKGVARGGGQLEFRLVKKPSHGKITQSKPIGPDGLQVTYRQSGGRQAQEDSFIFSVRSRGIGPFSPGVAKIKINDLPGRLQSPELLEFPSTLAGATSVESFVVSNEGGDNIQGKIHVTPPWKLIGPSDYNLKSGGEQKLVIIFAPESEGQFLGSVRFDTQPPVNVELKGEGVPPFLVANSKIILEETPTGKRAGRISLQNNTPEPLEIQIKSELATPGNITLKFGEAQEFSVEDDGIGPLQSFVLLTNSSYSKRIEVSAPERTATRVAPIIEPAIATYVPPKITPDSSPSPSPSPTEILTPLPIETTATPLAEQVLPPGYPPIPPPPTDTIPAKLTVLADRKVRLEWPIPNPPKTSPPLYRVELRSLTRDAENQPKIEWLAVPKAKLEIKENKGSAIIDQLTASSNFAFRVTQLTSGQMPGISSTPLFYRTPPGFSLRSNWLWLITITAGIMVFLVAKKRWQERAAGW